MTQIIGHVSFSANSRRRGSAMVLALIVILVLSVIGVGVAYMSSTEDRISGNVKLEKEGFYAAETGLRAAEAALSAGALRSTVEVGKLLNPTGLPSATTNSSPNTFVPPGGGYTAQLLMLPGAANQFRDKAVEVSGSRDQVRYSLYVRNDREDPSGSATVDSNQTVNIIAVGFVTLPDSGGGLGKRAITKILEEQLVAKNVGTEGGSQKGGNGGGTGGGAG